MVGVNFNTSNTNNKYYRGWDRRDSDSMGTINWSGREFSIAPVVGQDDFNFWAGGRLFAKSASESVTVPNVSGIYYIYYDTDGVLQYVINSSLNEALFKVVAITGLCYVNATETTVWYAKDEQHGIIMDSATHFRLHLTNGATHMQGALITGLVDGDSTYTNIAVGVFADEDITFTTVLASIHSFLYRDGVNGDWRETALDNECGHVVSGDTDIYWNENTSGTVWQLTESNNATDYVIMFFIWTNFTNSPIKKIIGQQTYSSRSKARAGIRNELTAINLEGISTTESTYLYAYICKGNGDVEDDGEGNDYVDLRTTKGYNLPD